MVYVSTFEPDLVVGDVEPAIRNDMIRRCTDKLAKQQRYCVWKLLDYALRDCYNGGVADFDLYVDENGKWNCHNGIHFSLSHCNNVVAVALCNHYVGVDVESVAGFDRHVGCAEFAERILTDNEQRKLTETPTEHKAAMLAEMWTKKESFFKLGSRRAFVPKSFDSTVKATHSQTLTINGVQYVLSVARYIPSKIELVTLPFGQVIQCVKS